MGVDGFWDLVTKKCGSAFYDLDDCLTIRGKRWVVDISGFLYAFVNGKDEFGNYRYPERVAPIDDVLNLHERMLEGGIEPIYIFDGKTHPLKRHEHLRREKKRQQDRANIEQYKTFLKDVAEKEERDDAPISVETMREMACGKAPLERRLNRKVGAIDFGVGMEMTIKVDREKILHEVKKKVEDTMRSVSDECIREIMITMDMHNIPFYISNGDAERLGAQLTRKGMADVLVTDDGDGIVFDATIVLRNFRNTIGSRKGPSFVDPAKIRSILGLTKSQLVDVCLMSGTDFTGIDKKSGGPRGIPTIGMMRAIPIIKKHGSLENYLKSNEWKIKYAQIKTSKNENVRAFELSEFHYQDAHAYFLGDEPEYTYASKAIDPAAGPIPDIIRPAASPSCPKDMAQGVPRSKKQEPSLPPLHIPSLEDTFTPPLFAPIASAQFIFPSPASENTSDNTLENTSDKLFDTMSEIVFVSGTEYPAKRIKLDPSTK